MYLPESQSPVPAIFSATLLRNVPAESRNYVYLRFQLWEQEMSPALQSRLEVCGVECLSSGESHTAYGIAPDDSDLLELFASDDEIVSIETQEPCAGK